MARSVTVPVPTFFFRCKEHGEYVVSQETLRRFISSKELLRKLDDALKSNVSGIVLAFDGPCPRCTEGCQKETKTNVTLMALRKRKH